MTNNCWRLIGGFFSSDSCLPPLLIIERIISATATRSRTPIGILPLAICSSMAGRCNLNRSMTSSATSMILRWRAAITTASASATRSNALSETRARYAA